ncbi:glycoside hydrolase/deacetylase, partial [Exidia glandulosa HHB12029]
HHDHEHTEQGGLPTNWFHERDHPVHSLFSRADPPWLANFPANPSPDHPGSLPVDKLPKAWTDAYEAAVANGKIPAIPPTTVSYMEGWAKYPDGFDPTSREVCSSYEQCYTDTDLVDPPSGVIVISFDDGPADGTATLLKHLGSTHQRATHFMIGSNIRDQPDLFTQAFRQGGDIAVHTYTHPYMTSLSDYGVLAELGYTMQIIHDSTDGRVPRYWRPPFGDMDNRVRAIASEVFGLTPVMWNRDTNDWAMPDNQDPATILTNVTEWLGGDSLKDTKGRMLLEHELTEDTANVFINTTWPLLLANHWKPLSVAQTWGHSLNYANAVSNADV